jgi:hypothetical protein
MNKRDVVLSSFLFLLSACVAPPPPASQTVSVYATSAAEFWLTKLFVCANDLSIVLNVSAADPDIYLRVGEPEMIVSPAYQIGEEEIVVAVNRKSSIQELSLAEAQEIFARGNPSAQVWVFASGADIQIAFDQLALKGRSVSSSAKVAPSAPQMSAALNSDVGAIGILPRHSITDNIRVAFLAGKAPVLALTKKEPPESVKSLIVCLQ